MYTDDKLARTMEVVDNNRDRSYSRESVQYASESSSSESGQNRMRADTGDSSLSSDTNLSSLSMGPRRRSHRPRGCRGGRKNRKKKNKVPGEIAGPAPIATAIGAANIQAPLVLGTRNQSYYHNDTGNAPNPPVTTHHPSVQKYNSASFSPVLSQSYNQQQHNHQYQKFHHHHQQQYQQQHQIMQPSPMQHAPNSMHTSSTAYSNNHNPTSTLDSAQSVKTTVLDDQGQSGSTSMSNASSMPTNLIATMVGEILPPPPTIPKTSERITPGPNPYALTKQILSSHHHQHHSYADLGSSLGPLATSSTAAPETDENSGHHHDHPSGTGANVLYSKVIQKPMMHPMETTYTNEVLCESLFVVSPRSFLTGNKASSF